MEKICLVCEKEFKGYKKSKFCSKKCFGISHQKKEDLICPVCQKEFISDSYKKTIYCSRQCSAESKKKDRKVVCKNCKNIFENYGTKTAEFCCKPCYWEYRKKNPEIIFQANQKITLITKECLNCKKEYTVHPYRTKSSNFCSVFCYNDYRNDKLKCPTCKKEFVKAKYLKQKYCSDSCAAKGIEKRKSKLSKEVNFFLRKENWGLEEEFFLRLENKKIFCDFLIEKKIVVECYGDYWHCNPDIYSADYKHTKLLKTAKEVWEFDEHRESLLKTAGYKVIKIWEKDWNKNNKDQFYLKELINNIKNGI